MLDLRHAPDASRVPPLPATALPAEVLVVPPGGIPHPEAEELYRRFGRDLRARLASGEGLRDVVLVASEEARPVAGFRTATAEEALRTQASHLLAYEELATRSPRLRVHALLERGADGSWIDIDCGGRWFPEGDRGSSPIHPESDGWRAA